MTVDRQSGRVKGKGREGKREYTKGRRDKKRVSGKSGFMELSYRKRGVGEGEERRGGGRETDGEEGRGVRGGGGEVRTGGSDTGTWVRSRRRREEKMGGKERSVRGGERYHGLGGGEGGRK